MPFEREIVDATGRVIKSSIVALFVALATEAVAADVKPSMHVLWSGDPSDDESAGAYDKATGLGSSIGCTDGRKHVLSVQFSYSRSVTALPFYADIEPAGGPPAMRSSLFETLTSEKNTWNYRRVVRSCAKRYTISVGYPKPSSSSR